MMHKDAQVGEIAERRLSNVGEGSLVEDLGLRDVGRAI